MWENLAELCGDGTRGCHGLVQRLDREACSRLRWELRDDQLAYVLERKSEAFLERYLPLTP